MHWTDSVFVWTLSCYKKIQQNFYFFDQGQYSSRSAEKNTFQIILLKFVRSFFQRDKYNVLHVTEVIRNADRETSVTKSSGKLRSFIWLPRLSPVWRHITPLPPPKVVYGWYNERICAINYRENAGRADADCLQELHDRRRRAR